MKGKGLLAAAMAFAAMDDLPEMRYSGSKPIRKSPLTKKQKKVRVRAKIARKSRKINKR